MANNLSHSSVSKFQHCATAWKHHYVNRIRPIRSHAALNFGTAIDKAIEAFLKKEGSPEEIFTKEWRFQNVNGKETYIPESIDIVYAESDFDKDLIDQSKLEMFKVTMDQITQAIDYKEEKGYENIPDEIKRIANIGYWLTLHTKGLLMIEAYRETIIPKIVRVLSIQEKIELENGEGDKVIGFIDTVLEFLDHGNVISDNKTSARDYKPESVRYSPQLTLYVNAVGEKYNTRKAAFIVMSKQITKNKKKICKTCSHDGSDSRAKTCDQETIQVVESKKGPIEKSMRCNGEWNETIRPKARIQLIVDEIPEAAEDLVMSNIDDINNAIKTGIFTKNLSKCTDSYGRDCEFLKLCYEGKMDGLVISEKKT